MSQYKVPDGEEYLECPYDRTHMVRAKRFQYHLMKCRSNYKGKEYATCPFNAKHEMPKPELRHHIASCPDKAMVDREFQHKARMQSGDDSTLKGYTDIPLHSEMNVPETESWDDESAGPVRVGVDPTHFSRVRFMNIGGMSTGEKKKMRNQGNLPNEQKIKNMMADLQISGQGDPDDDDGPLRLPKSSSHAAMANRQTIQPREQPVSSVFAYSIGRGRGRRQDNGVDQNGQKINGAVGNGIENGEKNGHDETPTVLYDRNSASEAIPRQVIGRGRGLAPGLGRGMSPIDSTFVTPPPGFGGRGRASALGMTNASFPQFIVPKVGNGGTSASPYIGEDPWSTN